MGKKYIKTVYPIVLFLVFIITFAGCAGKGPSKKQKKIQQMSDTDLVNYYHGINDRIKDIDNDVRDEQLRRDNLKQDDTFVLAPFFIGGRGHDLEMEKKLIIKELNKRNISY